MKIICVGMNYPAHNRELDNPDPTAEPVLFLKPETALARQGWPFFMPDFSQQVEYETELVVRINHLGKSIPERYAHRYYDEVTVGLDFTCRDVQNELRHNGLPWEISKGFDGSAHVGEFVKLADVIGAERQDASPGATKHPLHFTMQLNGEERQHGDTGQMLFSIDRIIAYASRFYLLKTGDLIFTGTPAGVGTVKPGDVITAQLEGRDVLHVRVK